MAISFSTPAWNSNVGSSVSSLIINDHLNASKTYIMVVASYVAASDPNVPTMSGLGTWTSGPTSVATLLGAHVRVALFAIDGPASAGNMTADFGGQTQNKIAMSIDEAAGTNPAASLFVASNKNSASGNSGTATVTLANALGASNMNYTACFSIDSTAVTQGTGMTLIDSSPDSGAGHNGISTEYGNTLTGAFVGSYGNDFVIVATEINVNGGGGGGGATINDHNLRGVSRGVGLGVGRGLSSPRYLMQRRGRLLVPVGIDLRRAA